MFSEIKVVKFALDLDVRKTIIVSLSSKLYQTCEPPSGKKSWIRQ